MNLRLKQVELSETQELEPLVIQNLGTIEQGLVLIDNQVGIRNAGRPDILAADEDGSAVIIELKNEISDLWHIEQGIRYYEWISQNIAWLSRAFPSIDPHNEPRILLVAPSFDDTVLRVARYVNLNLELIKYTAFQDMDSQNIGIHFETIECEPPQESGALRSAEEILEYSDDEPIKSELLKIVNYLKERGCELRPYKGGKSRWIEFVFMKEGVFWLKPLKKWIRFQYKEYATEKWPVKTFYSFSEWEKACKTDIEKYLSEFQDA